MPLFEVQGSDAAGFIDDVVPEAVAQLSAGELGSREAVQRELDMMMTEVRKTWQLEPDQVMRLCMAFSARCSELYVHLHRVEGRFREYKQVRTQQVMPLLAELDRQRASASRLLEVRRQDLEMSR